jgi:hypothetical protein
MTKELEALKELERGIKDRVILAEDRQLKLCAVIKQALLKAQETEKEIEIIEKELKAYYELKEIIAEYDIKPHEIRGALLSFAMFRGEPYYKIKKALEIIKEKQVDVFSFKVLTFKTFNQLQRSCELPELTPDEYNLLKEVLE